MVMPKDEEATRVAGQGRPREIEPNEPAPARTDAGGETRIIRSSGNKQVSSSESSAEDAGRGGGDEQRTIIHRVRSETAEPSLGVDSGEAAPSAPMAEPSSYDPVTGWLVTIAGPGKGRARPIFEGMNSVGRDPQERIPLNFGDSEISRNGHFFVTYEPKKRTFHINHGSKTNLVYLNNEVLLGPMSLSDGDIIEVGRTKLRFVPLCGPAFSWNDSE